MTPEEFNGWKQRGVFTVSYDRIMDISNHISEGESGQYSKKEAAEAAKFWALSYDMASQKYLLLKTSVQTACIKF